MPGAAGSSIRSRLLAANFLLLPVFLVVTFWVLDRAFAAYQVDALQERLRLQHLLLAKAADWDGSQWRLESLDEPRLELPDSGLYAFVLSARGELSWHSPSASQIGNLSEPLSEVQRLALQQDLHEAPLGSNLFRECSLQGDYYCHATGIAWGSSGPGATFLLMESQDEIVAARDVYRAYLLGLSVALSLLLLLALTWVVRWGLAPLQRLAGDIRRLQVGELDRLDRSVPRELMPLTESVNQLLASEKNRRERVRNTMDRLTHVLKTPLMLLRNSREEDAQFRELVQEQVSRMLGIVEGELARARLDGRAPDVMRQFVPVRPVLTRIVEAYRRLPRLHTQAEIAIDVSGIADTTAFQGDERDLQDLFGSLLENSMKYCRARIEVVADIVALDGEDWLSISVSDDGDGIPPGFESQILRRGARADTGSAGQGLGLAIVAEIVSAYGGSLQVESSAHGGAMFVVNLPGARSAEPA